MTPEVFYYRCKRCDSTFKGVRPSPGYVMEAKFDTHLCNAEKEYEEGEFGVGEFIGWDRMEEDQT